MILGKQAESARLKDEPRFITVAWWLVVLIMPLLAMTNAADGRELLAHGDFETGESAWEQWHCKGAGAVGVVYSSSDDTRPDSTGKRSLQIDTTDTFTCDNWIKRPVYGLRGDGKYRFSIWYKIVAGGNPDGPIESVIVRNMKNDTNQDRLDLYFDMTVDGQWKYVAGEFTAEATTTPEDFYRMMVHPNVRGKGGKGGIIRLDDFSLWDLDPLPVAPHPYAPSYGNPELVSKPVPAEPPVVMNPTMADKALAKLMSKAADAKAKRSGKVEAGILDGFPYLRNEQVIYLWSGTENGGGILRIRDLRSGKQLLRVAASEATLWKLDLKRSDGERLSYENAGMPCKVKFAARKGEGKLSFTWPLADVRVKVETRLRSGESLARSRIQVKARNGGPGLVTVTFPVLTGLLPFTKGGESDQILSTNAMGEVKKSPLVSGETLNYKYPLASMQFTALMGNGQGLYCAEEDGQANRKYFIWTPDAESGRLAFSIAHPVLNWGAKALVREYRSPGDIVVGPFQGDWFDAARIYREWALTAPWCRKGPIYQRADYPQWLVKLAYWTGNRLRDGGNIEVEDLHRNFYDVPESAICHDYGWMSDVYDHDTNPDYLPPRIGSKRYIQLVQELQAKNIRVVPYVIGWLWNTATESYRMEDAEHKGGLLMEQGIVPVTYAGSHDLSAAMCPATKLWRRKMVELSKKLVGKYGVDGVYFDYFTNHTEDCFNTDHGHPIAGGDYWSKGVHELYEEVRRECKKLNPEVMLCAEDTAEFCIDVLETVHTSGVDTNTPVYFAVYHDYTQVFGGVANCSTPQTIGRWWMMGTQNGRNNVMPWLAVGIHGDMGFYYRDLLRCHDQFARPYLGYGEMLRPPRIEGNLPVLPGTACGQYEPAFPVKAVEGSAWRAPDGTVGLFFLNYDKATEHAFTWTQDLNEIAEIGADRKLKVTRWTPAGEEVVGEWAGGVLTRTMTIEPWGLIALKLEAMP